MHQLWVLIAECLRALTRLAIPRLQMDQSHPRLCHGLVVTLLQVVDRSAPGDGESLKSSADFTDGLVERMTPQVKERDLDVIAMVKFLKRACFERAEKFLVAHASWEPETLPDGRGDLSRAIISSNTTSP